MIMTKDIGLHQLQEQVTTIQKQLESMQAHEATVQKMCEDQQRSIDARFQETQTCIEKVMRKDKKPQSLAVTSDENTPNPTTIPFQRRDGKHPIEVIVIDDQKRFTFKPQQSGLLPKKILDSCYTPQQGNTFFRMKGRPLTQQMDSLPLLQG
ncbi:hypothetical protein GOBAR_DD03118 [Gossypium barbadense]|nr:hypothetical protein GOBAR_DD03118 [Gossypium barbadense]